MNFDLTMMIREMIKRGNTEGLLDKLDVLYAGGRLPEKDYEEFKEALTK